MCLLKQKYGFFGIHAGKIWHLPQWPEDSWMAQAVSSSTHWQLQRALTPFPQDKVWNVGRRKRGTARQELKWDRLFRKGTGAECFHDSLPLQETTFCFSRINPEGSQEQESQTTHRRSTFPCWPQQSSHFAWQYFQWAERFLDSLLIPKKTTTLQLREIFFLPKVFRTNWQPNVCRELELDKLCLGQHNSQNASNACKLRHFLSLLHNSEFFKAKNRLLHSWG